MLDSAVSLGQSRGEAVAPCGFPTGSEWRPFTATKGAPSVHMVLKCYHPVLGWARARERTLQRHPGGE